MSALAVFLDGRRGRLSSLVALLALVSGLVISLVQPLLPRDGVSGTAPFVDAVRAKAGELKAGDVVLVHPPWRDDVVTAVEEAGVLPKGAQATVALALPHGQDPGRVLLVRDPGAPSLPRARRRQASDLQRVGDVDVGWLTSTKGEAAASDASDLGAQIALARVHVEKPDGSLVKCTFDDGRDRHICPGLSSWMYVGVESVMVGGDPSRCIWSHPITDGKVVVRYDDVSLGDELRFTHALSDTAASNARGAPVTAELFVDGKSLGKSVRTSATGWQKKTFRVPSPGRAAVTLEITTKNDGARHYCWKLSSSASERGAK